MTQESATLCFNRQVAVTKGRRKKKLHFTNYKSYRVFYQPEESAVSRQMYQKYASAFG